MSGSTRLALVSHFHPSQLLEGVLDIGCWGIFLIIVLPSLGSDVVTAYSASILTSFGYTPKQSALLNIPSGFVNIAATLTYSAYVRYHGNPWLVNTVAAAIATTAAALLPFLPNSNRPGLLAGMYLMNFLPGASSIAFHWLTCNTAGHTKQTYATAGLNAAFAIGNIIGPLTFQAQDAPQFRPAKLTLVITWALSIGVSVLYSVYYSYRNQSRDQKLGATSTTAANQTKDTQAYAGLTDKHNTSSRYHL